MTATDINIALGHTEEEFQRVMDACRSLPPAEGNYLITDYVANLLLTVVDFQMQSKAVGRAMDYCQANVRSTINTHDELKSFLAQYPDTKEGNIELALVLWNYRLWTRAAMLRRLVEFFEEIDVKDQPNIKAWAEKAEFKDFAGKVKGLGYAVFQWLMIRQGLETIKPDVHVNRFVAKAVGRVLPDHINVAILVRVAKELKIKAYELDWAIWERGKGMI